MRTDFMGIPLDAVTLGEALDRVGRFVEGGASHQQVSLNAMKVVQLARDGQLRSMVGASDLVTADGSGVVIASRVLRRPVPEKVAGIDLFAALMVRAAERGWRPYLLGARPEVLADVVAHYRDQLPDLRLAGWHHGYYTDASEPDVVDDIAASRPDLLFIALGSPAKELFIERWGDHLGVPFMMGVGGSFDVVAGRVSRAPRTLQRAHLEWTWRLAQEPRRLWRRNLIGGSTFAMYVLRAKLFGYRIPVPA